MKAGFFAASATALALVACGPSEEETMTEDVATGQTTEAMEQEQEQTAGATMDPQAFANQMAGSDLYEIEAGKLAQEMGKNQSIKDFGAMMVKDHTNSSAELKQAAGAANPPVAVNSRMNEKHESDLKALRDAGENFDSVYKRQQIAAHEQAVQLLRAQAAGQGPFAAFAGKTAPIVEGHLERARQLPEG
jgi:putative membrane protein